MFMKYIKVIVRDYSSILLKRVNKMFIKYIKVIIRDYLSVLGYQMDHFVKKSTFWSKRPLEISLVVSP